MKTHHEKAVTVRHLRIIGSNLRANFALLLGLVLAVLASTFSSSAQALRPAELSVPASLVKVTARNEGSPGRLLVVVGETHVNLKVQQNVADLLSYLSAAYGMNLVCTEGTDAFPDLRPVTSLPSQQAARKVAEEKLRQRKINAVEYFALTHPNARVVGVENMRALQAHDVEIAANTKQTEQWLKDLSNFLQNDLANVKATRAQGERFESALND